MSRSFSLRPGSVKRHVKAVVPPGCHAFVRRLNRLRWMTKADVLRYSGVGLRDVRWPHVRYLLWDPEVESHTYDVANVEEMADFLAQLLDHDADEVNRYLREGVDDPEFTERWRRRYGLRFDLKSRLMLANRLLWWGLVRTAKPEVCVECGSYSGLGSLVLLRALERNAEEGSPGRLISIDADPTAGWVVPQRLRAGWTTITGTTSDVLEDALDGVEVSLLIHDTPHTRENAEIEFSTALRHAGEHLILLDSSGGQTGVLQSLSRASGGRYTHFRERPANHFRTSSGTGVGYVRRSDAYSTAHGRTPR